MQDQAVADYIHRVHESYFAEHPLLQDAQGRVAAVYFKCVLESRFQPIFDADQHIIAYRAEAVCRSLTGHRLSLRRLFDLVPGDEAVVRLDRLLRTVHVLNYFGHLDGRLPLWLRVHPRLPGHVRVSHGRVFETLLNFLHLQPTQLVIQLPGTLCEQPDLLADTLSNYQGRSYRLALQVPAQGGAALDVALAAPVDALLWRSDGLLAARQMPVGGGASVVASHVPAWASVPGLQAAGAQAFLGDALARPALLL